MSEVPYHEWTSCEHYGCNYPALEPDDDPEAPRSCLDCGGQEPVNM